MPGDQCHEVLCDQYTELPVDQYNEIVCDQGEKLPVDLYNEVLCNHYDELTGNLSNEMHVHPDLRSEEFTGVPPALLEETQLPKEVSSLQANKRFTFNLLENRWLLKTAT